MNKFKLSLLVSAFLMSGSVIAASDGALDTTSSGTSEVTIIKDNAVQISNVDDLVFEQQAVLAESATLSDDVCVFSSTGNYSVTVTSLNEGFELQGEGADPDAVTYSVQWGAASLAYGAVQSGLTADATSLTCDGGTNASFSVTVDSTSFNSVKPDTYTDTLTLLVQPE